MDPLIPWLDRVPPNPVPDAVGNLLDWEALDSWLDDLRARARREVTFTLECSGNHGFPFFIGGVGNARWGGTPLAPVLERAGLLRQASEVVFWGIDRGPLTIRDNPGAEGHEVAGPVHGHGRRLGRADVRR